jgi:hypothetical protein
MREVETCRSWRACGARWRWREALMGVSGDDVGTVEGNSQRHPGTALGTVNHLEGQMVVADGVCNPCELRQRRVRT